jgi:cell division septation protein DedD
MARSRLVALFAALALLAPASAFAQSAGDNQYTDPFGGSGGQQQSSSGSQGSSSSGSSGTTTTAQAPAPTSAPVATTAQSTTAATQQLPRTGHDPITPAVAGFWLLLGGVALRARVSRGEDRAPARGRRAAGSPRR